MARALSVDLRDRVVAAIAGGLSRRQAAVRFGVSAASAVRWQQLRHVVLPQLRPTTFFLAVIMTIETFRTFDVVYVMTGGGPRNTTELLVTYSYEQGFDSRAQGYGSAVGIVVFVLVLLGTVLWWRAQRRSEADL